MKERVVVLTHTTKPQQTIWVAMHQCYSSNAASDVLFTPKHQNYTEQWYGERVVKHLLAGNKGHYSPLEQASITYCVAGYPHEVVQQLTRHRIGVAFAVQSFRYTSANIINYVEQLDEKISIEDLFYWRPEGEYFDRTGKKYTRTEVDIDRDKKLFAVLLFAYYEKVKQGIALEEARQILPYAIRQNFVMTLNARSLMHILDLRLKKDAQLEIRLLCDKLLTTFEDWCPQIAQWYNEKRKYKGMLAP